MYYEIFFELGRVSYFKNDFEAAISWFTKAIEIDKNRKEAYVNRGISYTAIGNNFDSISDFTKAIEFDQNNSYIYFARGNSHANLEQYNTAISDYTQALLLDPKYSDALINRANSFDKLGHYPKAIIDYTSAIEIDNNIIAYNGRGNTYESLRDYEKAISDYTKAIELNRSYGKAYINRAVTYNALKQYQKAISDYDMAIELSESLAVAYNGRGNVYYSIGHNEIALSDYNKAILIDPNFLKTYMNRGLLYFELGKFKDAILDSNSYIYLSSINLSQFEFLPFALEYFEDYPENVAFILSHFEIEIDILLSKPFKKILKNNDDLNLILYILKKGDWYSENENQILEAIFRYHMGGCLTSYELLDSFDELSTNQEYYYWLLSSYEIQVNFKEDFGSGIEEMLQKQNCDIDNYYLGLAHLLNEEEEKAIHLFKKSSQFLFSRILLAFFTEGNVEKENLIYQLNQEILEFEFDNFVLNKKMSFDAYFHYFECKDYIEELKTFDGLKFDVNFTTFQSIFKLNDAARSELDILEYSLDIKKGIEEMYQEFENQFDPSLNLDQTKLKLTKTKEKFKDIFDKLERNIGERNDAENELRTVIESFGVNSIKFYSLLITYYYAQNKIDKKQAFYLTLFLVKIESDFRDKKLGDAITETYKTGLDTGKTITGNLALKIVLGLAKSGAPKLFEYLKEEDAFDKSETQYYKFKENIIHYFKMEKANQSNKKFEDKFRLIDYFVDID